MSEYPEHEKLSKVSDESHIIGEFLDLGIGPMGFALYEKKDFACECSYCNREEAELAPWFDHDPENGARIKDGVLLIERWVPHFRTIQSILAEYFGIDQDRIDAEKDAMLAAMRAKH